MMKDATENVREYREWIQSEKGEKPDLSKANLSKADLSGANLHGADLRWADLYGANLRGANLNKADLSGADLSKANLQRALFNFSNLSSTVGVELFFFDKRGEGYVLLAWWKDGERWFNAGCRSLSAKEALLHWGGPDYLNQERGQQYVSRIRLVLNEDKNE